MNPATLARQIREASGDAPATARALGSAAVSVIAPFLADPDDDVRLTATESLAAVAELPLDADTVKAVQTLAIKILTDDDDQIASTGVNILHKLPPKDRNSELLVAWSVATVDFVKEQTPIIAGYHGTLEDRSLWEGFLLGAQEPRTDPEEDSVTPETIGGLHTGLAKMGFKPSRDWFAATLVESKLLASETWIDRAVYMSDPWIIATLARMLDREDEAYTVSPDEQPKIIRVKDLAAWAILTILKPAADDKSKPAPAPTPSPVAKRRYSPEEINQVRDLARPHLNK